MNKNINYNIMHYKNKNDKNIYCSDSIQIHKTVIVAKSTAEK